MTAITTVDRGPRVVARRVTGVDAAAPTPPWMAARLRLAGIRPISLIVDISNYVMLELGQPLHFYDAEKLAGDIVVRRAHQGETLETLDGKTRKLHVEDLLITDDSGALGLAGVMGGASTEVSATTTEVLLEAGADPDAGTPSARETARYFEREEISALMG